MFKKYNNDRISAIIILTVLIGILLYFKFKTPVDEYIPLHEQWIPNSNDTLTKQDSLELKEPDAIYYDTSNTDNMLDIDMDCGDDNYYDSIPKYDSFNDVPAGSKTVICVDGILYKMNYNKTSWTPIYPDEYRAWIGDNGDTIWE